MIGRKQHRNNNKKPQSKFRNMKSLRSFFTTSDTNSNNSNIKNSNNESSNNSDSSDEADDMKSTKTYRRNKVDEVIKNKLKADATQINYSGQINRYRIWASNQIPKINIERINDDVGYHISEFMYFKSKEEKRGYQTVEAIYNATVN